METVNASSVRLLSGDCLEVLRTLEADSVDAVVTDPPAGISFMGKSWDSDKGSRNAWIAWLTEVMEEVYRVLKPGAHGLVWALPRTSHWTGMALEDAGFEVRDRVAHVFGSGFPKSANVSKHIDRMAGAEREKVGQGKGRTGPAAQPHGGSVHSDDNFQWPGEFDITAPATQAAKDWEGWGTALKPAVEDWWLIRKPLSESSVARNVLKWNCGAINIDQTRVNGAPRNPGFKEPTSSGIWGGADNTNLVDYESPAGRWPPNLLLSHSPGCVPTGERRRVKGAPGGKSERNEKHTEEWWGQGGGGFKSVGRSTVSHADPDGYESIEEVRCVPGCPVREMDEQSGQRQAGARPSKRNGSHFGQGKGTDDGKRIEYDSGGASRFFPRFHEEYNEGSSCAMRTVSNGVVHAGGASFSPNFHPDTGAGFLYKAKSSRAERNKGLEGMPEKPVSRHNIDGRNRDNGHNYIGAYSQEGGYNPDYRPAPTANGHPTVKPLALMDWLITLITPPGGTVLDPFMGSGSTGCSAARLGFDFIGIEMEEEYLEIARRRIAYWSQPEEVRATDKGKAPAKKRNDRTLFANGTVRRCPDHDNPIPSGSNSYSCGCAIQYGKTNGKIAESHSQPDTSLF